MLRPHSHKMKIFLVFLCISLISLVVFHATRNQKRDILFTGKIEAIDLGCWADGLCSMEVSGKEIVFGSGYSRSDWGKVTGIDLQKSNDYIGRGVEVYCRCLTKSYTLEGNKNYYIKLLNDVLEVAPEEGASSHHVE